MRVYVAGPVTGRPRRNLAMFERAAKQLVQAGHVPVVPHRHVPAQAEWHVAMRRCVALRAVPMDRVTCGGQSPPYEARR